MYSVHTYLQYFLPLVNARIVKVSNWLYKKFPENSIVRVQKKKKETPIDVAAYQR